MMAAVGNSVLFIGRRPKMFAAEKGRLCMPKADFFLCNLRVNFHFHRQYVTVRGIARVSAVPCIRAIELETGRSMNVCATKNRGTVGHRGRGQ